MHLLLPAIAGSIHGEMGKSAAKGPSGKPETTFGELIALHAESLDPQPAAGKADSEGAASTKPAAEHEETTSETGSRDTAPGASNTQSSASADLARAARKGTAALMQLAEAAAGGSGAGSKAGASVSSPADERAQTSTTAAHDKSSAHDKTSPHDAVSSSFKPGGSAVTDFVSAPVVAPATAQLLPVPAATPFSGVQLQTLRPEGRTGGASVAVAGAATGTSAKGSARYASASLDKEKDTSTVTNQSASAVVPGQDRESKSDAAGGKAGARAAAGQVASREGASSDTAVADAGSATTATEPSASKQVVSNLPASVESAAKPGAVFVPAATAAAISAPVSPVANAAAGNHLAATQQVMPAAATSPYQRLDQVSTPSAVMLHASANRVSVGIHDPSLGWIEVKTQAVAGQVSASLVTAASQAHQSLSAQLPSLTQFLADHEVKVGDVVVQQGNAGGEMSSSSGQRQQQEAGQQSAATSVAESPAVLPQTTEMLQEAQPLSYISIHA